VLILELTHALRSCHCRQAGADITAGDIEGTPHAAATGAPPGAEVYEINGPFVPGAARQPGSSHGTGEG
jgi:hypothetical protein